MALSKAKKKEKRAEKRALEADTAEKVDFSTGNADVAEDDAETAAVAEAVAEPPANRKKTKKNAGIDWERCAARGANSRRPTTTRPP